MSSPRQITGHNLSRWASAWMAIRLGNSSIIPIDRISAENVRLVSKNLFVGFSVETIRKFMVYKQQVVRIDSTIISEIDSMTTACNGMYSACSGLPPKSPDELQAMAIHQGFRDLWDLVAWSSILSERVASPSRYKTLGMFGHSCLADMRKLSQDIPGIDIESLLARDSGNFWYYAWLIHARALGVYKRRQIEKILM